MSDAYQAIGVALAFAVGILGHEFLTHLLAASWGDPAPRFQKRLTLDLRAHVDPLGTIIMPIFFVVITLLGAGYQFPIGYGKSHAIGSSYHRGPAARAVLVPLVGPAWTFLLAIVLGRTLGTAEGPIGIVFGSCAAILVFLTALELLPVPGRDGGRILARFLPPNAALKMEELKQYEALFLIGLYLLFPGAVQRIAETLLQIAF